MKPKNPSSNACCPYCYWWCGWCAQSPRRRQFGQKHRKYRPHNQMFAHPHNHLLLPQWRTWTMQIHCFPTHDCVNTLSSGLPWFPKQKTPLRKGINLPPPSDKTYQTSLRVLCYYIKCPLKRYAQRVLYSCFQCQHHYGKVCISHLHQARRTTVPCGQNMNK